VSCREILWKIKTLCRISCTAAQLTALLNAATAACDCPDLRQYRDYYMEAEPRQDIYTPGRRTRPNGRSGEMPSSTELTAASTRL